MRAPALIAVVVATLVGVRVSAHDFWLAAENWTAGAGGPITITAGIGERFPTRTNFRTRDNWLAEWKIVGSGSGAHLTKPVGLHAEFVPITDPTSTRRGDTLTVQLLAAGKPVPDAVVSAFATGDGAIARATTDRDGRATFTIDREGPWLIKTVHMVRLPPPSEAEWESYWVTPAFHTAGR